MDMTISIAVLVFLFVTAPLITLVHELGHALAGMLVGASHAVVQLGRGSAASDPVLRVSVGRTGIALMTWMPMWFGFYRPHYASNRTPRQRAWESLAGPLTSLIMVVMLGSIAYVTRQDAAPLLRTVVQHAAIGAFIQLVMTAIPMTYPQWMGAYGGLSSDTARALQALRQNNNT